MRKSDPMDVEIFRADFIASANARAETIGCGMREGFVEEALERLREAGEVPDWEPCAERVDGPRNRRIEMDAVAFDDADESVHLFLAMRDGGEGAPDTLTLTEVREQGFRRLQGVWDFARDGWIVANVEESRPIWSLARRINEMQRPSALRLHIVSDRPLSERVKEIAGETSSDGIPVSFQVWDLTRFVRIHEALNVRDDLEIDLSQLPEGGLSVLPATGEGADYEAYLAVVPAGLLADIYLRHGSRLLEGNVRTYLGRRGNVNKGINRTLDKEPHRFFAYNNGIACTASSVELREGESGGMILSRITDLQIVNGAQTTASLASARRDDKRDLARVFVPMKLSVVWPEVSVEVIPLISRYANSQNSVRKSDFFANHSFHRDLEQRSRRILASAVGGSQVQTHWYYERARGQWLNDQAGMTNSQRDAFRRRNPKNQVVTKTDLAVIDLSFAGRADTACKGAEKSFQAFAEIISTAWENDRQRQAYGDEWFRAAMARVILFRAAERLVGSASWYSGGGERRPIVAHSMGRLTALAREHADGGSLDWARVWNAQGVGEVLERQILVVAEAVTRVIRTPAREGQSPTEWAKMEACRTQSLSVHVLAVDGFDGWLRSAEDVKGDQGNDRANGSVDEGLAAMKSVMEFGQERWQLLVQAARAKGMIRPADSRAVYPVLNGLVPTDRQARQLLDLLERCSDAGLED